jgi:hypothetical protein
MNMPAIEETDMQSAIFRKCLISLTLILLGASMSGCSSTLLQGVEPSARTFHGDEAGPKDYYIGMDLNFAVDTPEEPHTSPVTHQFDEIH